MSAARSRDEKKTAARAAVLSPAVLEHIADLVASAPPLSESQRDSLRILLRPPAVAE